MPLGEDDRAVSIQVGAILLFAILIILLATYQAFVVPNQNRQVEANHVETITAQMQELRDAIVSMPSSGVDRSVTLTLGTTYPARIIATNPGPPSGALRTRGSTDPDVNLTVAGAVATDGEVDDVWNGTNRSYATGALVYEPGYNEFRNAPTVVYENTLLYHRFRAGNLTRAGQRLIDGDRLTLLTLDGSLDTAATSAVSVDLQAASASDRRIQITNGTGQNVTVSFASRFDAATWEGLFVSDGELANRSGHVVGVTESSIPGTAFDRIHVELEGDVTYSLRMAKVGVGTGVAAEPVDYLALPDGDERTVQEGSRTTLTVEARDALNNPVSGVTVEARLEPSAQNGTLRASAVTTDGDGRATFTYEAVDVDGASPTFDLDVSHLGRPDAAFDAAAAANASMNVTVQNTDGSGAGGDGGGGGAYVTSWLDPSGQTGVDCPDGPDDTCTLDASQAGTATLAVGTSPIADGASVEYAVNDTTVGSLDPTTGQTDAAGENSTTLLPVQTGGLKVYANSGASGDVLVFRIVNVVLDLVYNNDATAVDGPDGDSETGGVEFTMANQFGQSLEVTELEVSSPGGPVARLSDEVSPNDEPRRTEIYVAADNTDGWVDYGGGTSLPVTADMDDDGIDNGANPEASSGGTLTFQLFEFENNGGNRVDMGGRSFDVTVFYELADGTTDSKTVTLTPS